MCRLGFTAALGAEFTTHETISQQLGEATLPVLATFLLIIAASIIPIVRGSAITDDGAGPLLMYMCKLLLVPSSHEWCTTAVTAHMPWAATPCQNVVSISC